MNRISLEQKQADKFRGNTAVATRGLQDNALQLRGDAMSGKASSQSATQIFGGQSSEVITLELDAAGMKAKMQQRAPNKYTIQVMPSADAQPDNTIANEVITYNDVSSYAVPNKTCGEVIDGLSAILTSYSNEIDFEVDKEQNEIRNGVVFVNNFYAVFFTIWTTKQDDNTTRFEFRRNSGDALAAAKFLGDIKARFMGSEQDNTKQQDALINLELDTKDLELKMNDDQKEMMMIHEALISDDAVGDSLEETAENYLYGKLVERKAIENNKLDRQKLCETLMTESLLLHKDLSVARASLLILSKLVNDMADLMRTGNFFKLLNKVLEEQSCALIQNYVVQLLYTLANAKKDGKFDFADDATKKNLKDKLSAFEKTYNKSPFYKADAFATVYAQLE